MKKIVDGYVDFSVRFNATGVEVECDEDGYIDENELFDALVDAYCNGECENLGACITDDSNLDYDVEEDEDE